jgi:5-methylcytosine-specific restriction endonuclease McrA
MTSKTCTKCGETKPFVDFNRRKDSKDGFAWECINCNRKRCSGWYTKNADYAKSKVRKLRQSNPESNRQRSRKWAAQNRDIARFRAREWARNNPDKRKLQRHKRRAIKRQNGVYLILAKEFRRLDKTECAMCGSKTNLTIDHVIPLNRGGRHAIGNLQSLCGSCNSSKQDSFMIEWRVRRSA